MTRTIRVLFIAAVAAATVSSALAQTREDRTTRAVRRELLMLPYYGVFDHLAFQIDKGTVTLLGQVRTGSLKNDAERTLRDVEGVEDVVNNIEILPASTHDDQIRMAAFRAIYRHDALERYAIQAIPPIHIIVKNGHITLEGVVGSQLDKTIAVTQARSVPQVFSVTDNLRVDTR
jgi:hyperosmotically inducible protein